VARQEKETRRINLYREVDMSEEEKEFAKNVSWEAFVAHLRSFVEYKIDEVNEAAQKEMGVEGYMDDGASDRVMTLLLSVIPEHQPVEVHILKETLDYAIVLGAAATMMQALEDTGVISVDGGMQEVLEFVKKLNDETEEEIEKMSSTEGRNNPDSKQETIDRLHSSESIEKAAFGGQETMSSEQIIEAFKLSSN
jgi:hypothetical protein